MLAAAAVAIAAFVVTTWLLAIAGHAQPGTDRATARLDAVRTGLAAGAGAGAVVGLMLAFRRQHHQEIATVLTDLDATERRITDLYTKAVEQLGSDKAPVRLGGLYALERLAQDAPAHRQTIVNVMCAYLRMPFSPTAPTTKPGLDVVKDSGKLAAESGTKTVTDGDTWQQERQVRLTAQRILAEHLRDDRARDRQPGDPPSERFWPDIRLDLTAATLIDFDLRDSEVADASFAGATFTGTARFAGATFTGTARFAGATFTDALFDNVTFTDDAVFAGATFTSAASFRETTFTGEAWFDGATLTSAAFSGSTFARDASFEGATLTSAAFSGSTFARGASFEGATFADRAWFDRASFANADRVSFERSRILSPDAQLVWPTGWHLGQTESGAEPTVIRVTGEDRP